MFSSFRVDGRTNLIHLTIFLVSLLPLILGQSYRIYHPDDDMINQDVRVLSVTWNVNGKYPKENLGPLLQLNQSSTDNPHFIVVGLQEMPISASEAIFESSWETFLRKSLGGFGYVKIKSIRMYAISLNVFSRGNLLLKFRDLETSYMRTGLGGWFGNKGGVTVRLSVSGCHLAFVNCHLAAHEAESYLDQRVSDYKNIVYNQEFKTDGRRRVLDHDHVVIMGDLNFRIDYLSGSDIYNRIVEGSEESRRELLARDQLKRVQSEGRAFSEFGEGPIHFWPTYKFKIDTSIYDFSKRKPAYTDRVLTKRINQQDVGEGVNLDEVVVTERYSSHPNYVTSDHKPVSSIIKLRLFRKSHDIHRRDVTDTMVLAAATGGPRPTRMPNLPTIEFSPITNWRNDEDNEIRFSLRDSDDDGEPATKELRKEWDWIAVFPHDFDSLDQWICYTWVNDAKLISSSPAMQEGSPSSRDGDDRTIRYALTMRCLLPPGGRYRLIYFHEEQASSILGISEPFDVPLD